MASRNWGAVWESRDEGATWTRLANGSMSEGTERAAHWDAGWVGGGKLAVRRDSSVYHSAPASLHVASEGGEAQGQAQQTFDAAAGTPLTVSGWVRSRGGAKVNFAVQSLRAGFTPVIFEQVGYVQSDAEWTRFSKAVELPRDTAHAASSCCSSRGKDRPGLTMSSWIE